MLTGSEIESIRYFGETIEQYKIVGVLFKERLSHANRFFKESILSETFRLGTRPDIYLRLRALLHKAVYTANMRCMIVSQHHCVKAVERELHAPRVFRSLTGKPGINNIVFPAEFHEKRHAILREQLIIHCRIIYKTDKLQGVIPP